MPAWKVDDNWWWRWWCLNCRECNLYIQTYMPTCVVHMRAYFKSVYHSFFTIWNKNVFVYIFCNLVVQWTEMAKMSTRLKTKYRKSQSNQLDSSKQYPSMAAVQWLEQVKDERSALSMHRCQVLLDQWMTPERWKTKLTWVGFWLRI